MFEERANAFFQSIPGSHAAGILDELRRMVPILQLHPDIVIHELHRFRQYFRGAPLDSLEPAIFCLMTLADHIPESRARILTDLGQDLFNFRKVMPRWQLLVELFNKLDAPIPGDHSRYVELARSLVTLKRKAVFVLGAGLSYSSMPITAELSSLVVPFLRDEGIEDPVNFFVNRDEETWKMIKNKEGCFKERFRAWSSRAEPGLHHTILANLLDQGYCTHLVSFNWDDLLERASRASTSKPMLKITVDSDVETRPALWKLHGDVEDLSQRWVFPYEESQVFGSLMESLAHAVDSGELATTVIVGYSERDSHVTQVLISWLEANTQVYRVRPDWVDQPDRKGFKCNAQEFFRLLLLFMGEAGLRVP